ncbi:probable calcium-binding protein CML31 [Phalaenopsis equestris]|uniref:probable calcium-binding protein CML31 n=1 Tax=Phalaenopsis equestris TaxID=78828 RepID=UPI0009E1B653|nr:probable calcium-binding protein CML31 [Phalaenopsis equestris]
MPAILFPMKFQCPSSKLEIGSEDGRSCKSVFARIYDMLSLKKHKKPCSPSFMQPVMRETSPRHDLEWVFRFFDVNSDGNISATELCGCLQSAGEKLSLAEAEAMVESSDSDGDGVLSFDDFVRLVHVEEEEDRENTLKEAFSVYKMGGRDSITARSLRQALQLLGEEKSLDECRVMIKRFDLNGDGVICFDEFKLMML